MAIAPAANAGSQIQLWSQSFESFQQATGSVQTDRAVRNFTRNSLNDLVVEKRVVEQDIATTRFQAFHQGIEVLGAGATHHKTMNRIEVSTHLPEFDLDTKPALSEADALAIAGSQLKNEPLKSSPELKIFPNPNGQEVSLVWQVDYPSASFLIDAHSGKLVAEIPTHFYLTPPGTIQLEADTLTDGTPIRIYQDAHAESFDVAADATRAAENSKAVLKYFSDIHNRRSYDGDGAAVVSVVGSSGTYWDSKLKAVFYEKGDGVRFRSFTHSLDVAAHEIVHAFTGYHVNFLNIGESGSISEAFSDYFGVLIANDGNWRIGEDIFIQSGQAVRDLENPGSLQYEAGLNEYGAPEYRAFPSHMSERFETTGSCNRLNGYCGVHPNSTIFSHAMYRITGKIGTDAAEKIFYRAITHFIGRADRFENAAQATVMACESLDYPEEVCGEVGKTFAESGILDQ